MLAAYLVHRKHEHRRDAGTIADHHADAELKQTIRVTLGRRILEECEAAARSEGFRRLALMSTLPGLPLYVAYGFEPLEEADVTMPDGVSIACVSMEKRVDPAAGR